jgi:WD40 repeat protein
VFTVSEDGTLKSWDRVSSNELRSSPNPNFEEALYAVDCSPDGSLLAVGGKQLGLTLRDASSHDIVATYAKPDYARWYGLAVDCVRFSPDGTRLACGLRNDMILLEVPSLRRIATFTGLSGRVSSVAFTPDGQTLIGVSQRGQSQMVNLKVMRSVGNLAGAPGRLIGADFSPDGQSLAVSGLGSAIRVFHAPLNEPQGMISR